jgi:hypothetical protein
LDIEARVKGKSVTSTNQQDEPAERTGAKPFEETIKLHHIYSGLFAHKKVYVYCVSLFVLLALLFLHIATPKYQATIVLAPKPSAAESVGSSILSSFSSVGINLGSHSADFDAFIYNLKSTALAGRLEKKFHVSHILFKKQFELEKTNNWSRPDNLIGTTRQRINSFFNRPAWLPPSNPVNVAAALKDTMSVESAPQGTIFEVSVLATSPKDAAWLLQIITNEADAMLREQRLVTLKSTADQLSEQVNKTVTVDLHNALITSLVRTETELVAARVEPLYAAKIIAPIISQDVPARPSIPRVLVTFLALGLVASAAWSLALELWLKEEKDDNHQKAVRQNFWNKRRSRQTEQA